MDTYLRIRQKKRTRFLNVIFAVCILTFIFATPVYTVNASNIDDSTGEVLAPGATDDTTIPYSLDISLNSNGEEQGVSGTLQIIFLITILAIAPSILIMVTSFTRIVIVLHFTRAALGTQTTPPNQVLIGLSLFLTFFIMAPTFSEINTKAFEPYTNGEINQETAIENAIEPLRTFMYSQTNSKDLKLFLNIAEIDTVDTISDIPTTVLIPAYIISELRIAFIIGFVIYIPFIIIDMVVASTLMAMGMMMLPPTTISMPFKILLFILVDGWNLLIGQLIQTFYER